MPALKILIVCEHASNTFGGEAILPLNYFRYLSKTEHEVYLLTHWRVSPMITQLSDIKQNHVFYVPDTWLHIRLNALSRKLPARFSAVTVGFFIHLITQFYQRKMVQKIIKDEHIDLVHEPAPVSAIQPSMMFGLGVPVVIGPMNGGMSFPPAFQYMAGWPERILYRCVRLLSPIYNLLIPGKFLAHTLLVANKRTGQALPKFRLGKVVELVENGVFSSLTKPKPISQPAIINVLYAGRLIDLKMINVAIEAVANVDSSISLTILGDGPLRKELEQYAQINAPGRVKFVGEVPHATVNQYYDAADIFVLPSVRECGGAVVLEAMARGLPVIAVNWGGPADYITTETGFLVEPTSKIYMVKEFARIITLLAEQPEMRHRIGIAAISRVNQNFLWHKKIERMLEIYQDILLTHNAIGNEKNHGDTL